MLKKYWKIAAAAVFLTVAGFCYGIGRMNDGAELLPERGAVEDSVAVLPTSGIAEEASESPLCYVHVCGEVVSPGVYELPEGSRIFEAIEAAGGFTKDASDRSLNLAAVIADGTQIVVPNQEETEAISAPAGAADGTGSLGGSGSAGSGLQSGDGLVNLNTASKAELMTLPGIGETRAEDIIRYREKSGGFQSIEDIMNVSGIKDASFEKIRDRITV